MCKAVLFGGTTEGRELAEFMLEKGVPCIVCVASDYGGSLIRVEGSLSIHVGRLDEDEIAALLNEKQPEYVIDATHPYAFAVSGNIKSACEKTGKAYLRVKRSDLGTDGCTSFDDIDSLLESLDKTEGTVFLSTGSKDLKRFSHLNNFAERFYARVLPSVESINLCLDAGLAPSHIICMQGPFSYELNLAMFRDTGSKILVTKESGANGGFDEKLRAAKELNMSVFLLKRPPDSGEMSAQDVMALVGGVNK